MNQYSQLETIYPIIESLCADDYNELLKTMNLNKKTISIAQDALHKIIFRERSLSSSYVKNGKTNKGRQRYINKASRQSFSDTDKSIVRYTKKSYEQWSAFIKCMLYGLSLRKTALPGGHFSYNSLFLAS